MPENKVTVVIAGQNDAGVAFTKVGEQLAALNEKLLSFGHTLEQLAIAEISAKLLEFGKGALEAEANLAKMSERTGIGVEKLSELTYAAQITGVSVDSLEKGIKKLQVSLEAAGNGGEKQTAAFTALGISVKDANGKILEAGPAMDLIGEKFAGIKNGTDKAALSVAIFGRSGTELIPLLNRLRELEERARQLGITVTDGDVKAALEFEESMVGLRLEGEALTRHFLTGLLPALGRISSSMSGEAKDNFNRMTTAGEALGWALKQVAVGFYSVATTLDLAIENMPRLASIMLQLAADRPVEAIKGIKQLFEEIHTGASDQLIHQFEEFKASLFAPLDPAKGDDGKPKPPPKPVTHEDTGRDAVIKARLKAETDAAQLSANFQKSMNDLEQKNLDELYKHELISVQAYFDKKKQLQLNDLAAEARALNEELNLQADGIAALNRKIAAQKNDIKGKQEANKLRVEEITLQEQFDRNVERLRVNQHAASELQHKDAQGNIDELAVQAEQMDRTAAQAQRLAERIDDIYAVLQEQIARVTVAEKNHELTATEAQARINSLNAQGVQELAGMIQRYNDLAQASGDPKLIVNAEKLTTRLDELGKKANWVSDQIIDNAQSSFENLFTGIMDGSKTAAQSFADFGLSIISDIDKIIAKMLAMWLVQKLIGFFIPSAPSTAGLSSISAAGSNLLGLSIPIPGFTGGKALGGAMDAGTVSLVGENGPELFFAGTSGTVVPNSQLGHMGGGGSSVNVNINVDARGADKAAAAQMALTMQRFKGEIIRETIARIGDKQLRH